MPGNKAHASRVAPAGPIPEAPRPNQGAGLFFAAPMLPDWKDIGYLRHGSAAQQRAYHALHDADLLARLRPFGPVLVGTFPLDLTVPGSDLDIICEVPDEASFRQALAGFASYPGYAVRPAGTAVPAVVVSFELAGLPVEIFGQAVPTVRQYGYRHLVVEARLLALGGPALRAQALALKADGLKTEPAFARLLGLPGNPYQALLALETEPDAALRQLLAARP